MIVAFLVFLPFTVLFFFTNFDSVYFRFDLTLFTFRLLDFVIDIPSYFCKRTKRINETVKRLGRPLLLSTLTSWDSFEAD